MIRFIDLRHVDMGTTRFGFWDTVTDQMVDVGGVCAFSDQEDLIKWYAGSGCGFPLARLVGHLPSWALTADPDHDSDDYEVRKCPS